MARTSIVLTLTGKDRIGIVEEVTKLLLDLGGNVETSRMARLGGEFAILMLASMPGEQLASLARNIGQLTSQGYKITTSQTAQIYAETHPEGLLHQVEIHGADHEGIVHGIAHYLSQRNINIESMDTGTTRAPVSGTPLFTMSALVAVPESLRNEDWEGELKQVADHLNMEIKVTPATR